MLLYLLLLFTVVPLVELWLLLQIAEVTSLGTTLVLVIITGIVGAALARRQGWNTWQRIQSELSQGKMPGSSLMDGLMILVAGALLVTPGVLTDLVGFSLLIPPIRAVFRRVLAASFKARTVVHFQSFGQPFGGPPRPGQPQRDDVIDVEYTRVPEKRVDDRE